MVIAEPGLTAAYLAPLPVWSLRVNAQTTDALLSVGVETIGSLLHLPRSSLTSRFGDSLLDRLDQALGDLPELLTPYRPQVAMTSRLEFGGTTDRWEVLLEAVRQATTRFCSNSISRRRAATSGHV
jgi:protein ImuB